MISSSGHYPPRTPDTHKEKADLLRTMDTNGEGIGDGTHLHPHPRLRIHPHTYPYAEICSSISAETYAYLRDFVRSMLRVSGFGLCFDCNTFAEDVKELGLIKSCLSMHLEICSSISAETYAYLRDFVRSMSRKCIYMDKRDLPVAHTISMLVVPELIDELSATKKMFSFASYQIILRGFSGRFNDLTIFINGNEDYLFRSVLAGLKVQNVVSEGGLRFEGEWSIL
ncbi:hypothetical protein Syun_009292 [Stephania yunnanensis]|uniref:Uncharacterized protein n=1 Tax=Stephania yunnanensis TaxID=152371 RepID=A0AAP0PND9_9MAGN